MSTRSITLTGTDDSGATYALSGTVTGPAPAKPAQRTLFGSDASPINMTRTPGMSYTRLFPGTHPGIPALKVPPGVLAHVEIKDPPTAALVHAWMDAMPAPACQVYDLSGNAFDTILEWHHEFEGDMTLAQYRSGVTMLLSAVRSHPNAHRVRVAQTFTGYAQRHGKTGPNGETTSWRSAFVSGVDIVGMDFEKDLAGYPDPAVVFAPLDDAVATLGVMAVVAELGVIQMATDTARTGLAAQYTKLAAHAVERGYLAVAAYDTPQPPAATGNYWLGDTKADPALAAWCKVMAAR